MSETQARKTVLLAYLFVIAVFTFGGLWGGGILPHPKKYLGATIAYMTLAIAAEFVAPLATAFALLFAFYILLKSLPQINAIAGASGPATQSLNNNNTGQKMPGTPVNFNSPAATKF